MAEQFPDEPDAAVSSRSDDAREPRAVVEDRIETVRVRRAPKYSVFLAAGAGLGILVALILTFAFNGTGDTSPNTGMVYSQAQVFGFVALICITVGIVVGGVVALILDRVLARRAREVRVDRETIHIEE
ncbi:potassium transporter Trk [Microbacterium sp.]|uniref:potassium transporter Trk n=1 Tax=Microbacterium sp. TaxID=51671 RepID=UPI002E3476DB|nr:potassium transporter Trk [Microbacterium sp.]HEX5729170.1 potassium transporter Trk [Microbacterium sp.]